MYQLATPVHRTASPSTPHGPLSLSLPHSSPSPPLNRGGKFARPSFSLRCHSHDSMDGGGGKAVCPVFAVFSSLSPPSLPPSPSTHGVRTRYVGRYHLARLLQTEDGRPGARVCARLSGGTAPLFRIVIDIGGWLEVRMRHCES